MANSLCSGCGVVVYGACSVLVVADGEKKSGAGIMPTPLFFFTCCLLKAGQSVKHVASGRPVQLEPNNILVGTELDKFSG